MNDHVKQTVARKFRRLFDAFDLSSWNDRSSPAIAARSRVIDSSNAFLGPFLNLWLLLSVMVGVISWLRMPQAWYVPVVMLISGVVARYAVFKGRMPTARWIFITPLVLMIFLTPPFVNGVRTPLLANIPSLIVLSGWMMGRRVMALIGVAFAFALAIMWFTEEVGWWQLPVPLRDPEVWLRAFLLDLVCSAVTVAALIGSYQAELRQRFTLEARLSSVLQFSETVIQRSPLPMCVFEASGHCIEINEAYEQLFEISRDDVLKKHFNNLPMSSAGKDYAEAIATRTSRECELSTLTSSGKAIWLDLRFLPFEIDDQPNLLIQCIDLTERKRLNAELEALAFNDSLTGLANRRLFFDRLDQALNRSHRSGAWGAILLLDLNRFKELNDTHGHEAGDKLLVEVANRLRANSRVTDTVARLGGDEFVLLLEDIGDNINEATEHVEKIVVKMQGKLSESYDINGAKFLGSASIGFALFDGVEEEDAAFLLRKADASMYVAKKRQSS